MWAGEARQDCLSVVLAESRFMQNINQSFPFSPFMNFNNWSSWPQPSNKLAICFPTKYDLVTKVRDHIPQPEWKMPQITGLHGVFFLFVCTFMYFYIQSESVVNCNKPWGFARSPRSKILFLGEIHISSDRLPNKSSSKSSPISRRIFVISETVQKEMHYWNVVIYVVSLVFVAVSLLKLSLLSE